MTEFPGDASSDLKHTDKSLPAGPALNYCSQCGTLLQDRYAFGQIRRYCPACNRVVFREHKVAAALLVIDATNRVLLVRRAMDPQKGRWSLPAGFVNYEEPPADAAVRECQEETGLLTRIEGLIDVVAGREHGRGADIVIVYRGTIVGGILEAADDAAAAGFFALDALPVLAFEATRRTVSVWAALQPRRDGGSDV